MIAYEDELLIMIGGNSKCELDGDNGLRVSTWKMMVK